VYHLNGLTVLFAVIFVDRHECSKKVICKYQHYYNLNKKQVKNASYLAISLIVKDATVRGH
jgi:hypothetical protein